MRINIVICSSFHGTIIVIFHSTFCLIRLSEASVEEDLSRLQSRVADLRVKAQSDAEIEQQTRSFLEVHVHQY